MSTEIVTGDRAKKVGDMIVDLSKKEHPTWWAEAEVGNTGATNRPDYARVFRGHVGYNFVTLYFDIRTDYNVVPDSEVDVYIRQVLLPTL